MTPPMPIERAAESLSHLRLVVHGATGPGPKTYARSPRRPPTLVTDMDIDGLLDFRRRKDEFFASYESPLTAADRADFAGLSYFEPDPGLVFTVPLQAGAGGEGAIDTTDGQKRIYRRAGSVGFTVAGLDLSLVVYDTGHPGFFIPFRDATSGKETYGGGRYLDIDPNTDETLTIDFNMAYNPYCVYSDGYSCPLPQPENWLPVPIEAGEQNFERRG